jgi:hypothetical protein
MIYGITTARAHLDALGPGGPIAGEIDWDALKTWINPDTPNPPGPAFTGRYFHGGPTRDEINARTPFCLWAHGEGAALSPQTIVPIQRADPVRQGIGGDLGKSYGEEDALALSLYLDCCLAVGDLVLNTAPVLVFLEVADGEYLSPEYWVSWASMIHDAFLIPATLAAEAGVDARQLLFPAILCAFVYDTDGNTYLPDENVQVALMGHDDPSLWFPCSGFWARRKVGDPGLDGHPFAWDNIGLYQQPGRAGTSSIPGPWIPVCYLRYYEGPGPTDNLSDFDVPADPSLVDTLSLLTIDLAATGPNPPLSNTFTATTWRADAYTHTGGILPVQFGVDKNRDLSPYVACFDKTELVVSSLPAAFSYAEGQPAPYHGTVLDLPAHGRSSIALRYYSRKGALKNVTRDEVERLSSAQYEVGITWEGNAPTDQGPTVYINALIRPFKNREGGADGKNAFDYARNEIGQPPHTTVYFAVDFPPGDPNYYGTQMPSYNLVVQYFRDVNLAYLDFFAAHPDSPYYIGAYAPADACARLYRAGLATHFWQPWPPTWGNNWKPFAHANMWQIILANTVPRPGYPDMLAQNSSFLRCITADISDSADINVAWGNPGTFVIFP